MYMCVPIPVLQYLLEGGEFGGGNIVKGAGRLCEVGEGMVGSRNHDAVIMKIQSITRNSSDNIPSSAGH